MHGKGFSGAARRRVLSWLIMRDARCRVNVSRSVTESGGLVWSTPKTWERRSVPFPVALADELAALMVGKGRDELVFTDIRGGVLRNSNYRARVFEPAVAECQDADDTFPSITPHDLRHRRRAWPSAPEPM
jgi:integrase